MDFISLLKAKGSKEVFQTLIRNPGRTFTINDLAKTAGVPFSSTWNIVKNWEKAGLIETGAVGKAIVVKLKDTELSRRAGEILIGQPTQSRITGVKRPPAYGFEGLFSDILSIVRRKRKEENR